MHLSGRAIWDMLVKSFEAWSNDRASSMGAALSYYTVFSIAPLLLIVIAVAGLFFGQDAVRGEIVLQLRGLIGQQAASNVESIIQNAWHPTASIIATAAGGLTFFLGATTVFIELQGDLNKIWNVSPQTSSGVWGFVRTRLVSFGLILAIGFLLLVSLVLSASLAAVAHLWSGWFGQLAAALEVVNFIVSFIVITLLFALIYKFLPNVSIRWRDVWIGAGITALLFSIGKTLLGLYIGNSQISSTFGAAGGLVVLLIWVYYAAQIFLFGAELTKVYAHHHGSKAGSPPQ